MATDARVSQLVSEILRTIVPVSAQVSQVVREVLWTEPPPATTQPQAQVQVIA